MVDNPSINTMMVTNSHKIGIKIQAVPRALSLVEICIHIHIGISAGVFIVYAWVISP